MTPQPQPDGQSSGVIEVFAMISLLVVLIVAAIAAASWILA